VGAQVGSGGLYNNIKNKSKPLVVADNKIGEWNNFHIIMKGAEVTVYLNGVLVTDNVTLENFWDRKSAIFAKEQIELQAHGTYVAYRNIYIREIPTEEMTSLSEEEKKQGFVSLFDGTNLDSWTGNTSGYLVEEGAVVVHPDKAGEGGGGNLYTKEEFADFIYRFDFQLTPGSNNGIGVHAPLEGDAAYVGMEIQVLDNEADKYKGLQPYQYHGSVYGVIPAKRGFLKPTGEWNQEEIMVKGTQIKVTLNGTVITEGDYAAASKNGTIDHKEHPGLLRTTGHIAFLGHGEVVRFKNMRVKVLEEDKKGKKKKKK
jgi:LEA14-like dessication related protein